MAATMRAESATGEPREATQQAFIQSGFTSADALSNLAMEPRNQNLFGTNDLSRQSILETSHPTATASGHPGEVSQHVLVT